MDRCAVDLHGVGAQLADDGHVYVLGQDTTQPIEHVTEHHRHIDVEDHRREVQWHGVGEIATVEELETAQRWIELERQEEIIEKRSGGNDAETDAVPSGEAADERDRPLGHERTPRNGVHHIAARCAREHSLGDLRVHVDELFDVFVEVVARGHRSKGGELGRGRMMQGPHDHRLGILEESAHVAIEVVEISGAEPGHRDGASHQTPGGTTLGAGSVTQRPKVSSTSTSAAASASFLQVSNSSVRRR